jgi:acyl-CoA hydrolase
MTIALNPDAIDLKQFLKPGDHVVWGQGCAEPSCLVEALIDQAPQIGSISAFTASSFSGLVDAKAGAAFTLYSMGTVGNLRAVAAAGLLNIIPCHVGQIGSMIEAGLIGCDVAFVQVSPADQAGNHSFGLASDYVRAAVAKARIIVAEVNEQVPYSMGDAVLSAARIDFMVPVSRPPIEVSAPQIGETDRAIARFASEFISDHAVLQVGVGAVPEAILSLLRDRRDLGVHSGMVGDALVDLVQSGVVTNATKPFDQGISITGALLGTRKLYDFAHRNPLIGMRDQTYTHGESVLIRIPNLVTLNSALEVDLSGQVNAEQSGNTYVGGTGGQVDFVRGGSRAPNGHSIIALPATAKGGTISRITASLAGPVTTARSEVDIIVTEFGAAQLKGQTLAERARRLVSIAHPDFREGLEQAAHAIAKRGF